MDTTLNKIREHSPCRTSWEKLLASLGKTKADDEPISFKYLLDVLGIIDAVWCLKTITYKEQCLFLADMAESVLPDFEKYSEDPSPRKCVQAVRDYKHGLIDEASLVAASYAASAAATVSEVANAIYADYVAYANAAAIAAAMAADDEIYADDVAYAVDGTRAGRVGRVPAKWKEIEALFIKYFVEK